MRSQFPQAEAEMNRIQGWLWDRRMRRHWKRMVKQCSANAVVCPPETDVTIFAEPFTKVVSKGSTQQCWHVGVTLHGDEGTCDFCGQAMKVVEHHGVDWIVPDLDKETKR